MDKIEGIPEGYRLGEVVYLREDRKNITFELIPPPIEQPKQLEAVIVVDVGPSITEQQDEFKNMLIAQDITEAGYTVRSVTIREREKGAK